MNTVYTTGPRYMCNRIPFCIIYHNDCFEMVEGTTEKDFRAPCRNQGGIVFNIELQELLFQLGHLTKCPTSTAGSTMQFSFNATSL